MKVKLCIKYSELSEVLSKALGKKIVVEHGSFNYETRMAALCVEMEGDGCDQGDEGEPRQPRHFRFELTGE